MTVLGADRPVVTSKGDLGTGGLPDGTTSSPIPRPRLLTRLVEEPAEVTLVSAPAGAGESTLLQALAIAAPTQLLRPFVDASPAVQELLRSDLDRLARADGLAARVVRFLGSADDTGEVPTLTPAEARVLRELPSLLTALEIATAQGVSVNTVKTHLRALYRKLDVSGRREAIEVARRHGLL